MPAPYYGCALQKEILVQGRLYISENHVCFNANIFGWVTNLVIAFSEITAIEKRLTAFVIPNAISIVTTTNTKGHFFASFLSRDSAHDLLMAAWRKSFPCSANAPANGANAYYRQNRSNLTLSEEGDDARSFTSARAPSESRNNRHRQSFSNASPTWTADEADWDDDQGRTDSSIVSRRRSKRVAVKKIFKDIMAPNKSDDESRSGATSPTPRKGRGRSVSELPAPKFSFDEPRNGRDSIDQDRQLRPRAGTMAAPATKHLAAPGNGTDMQPVVPLAGASTPTSSALAQMDGASTVKGPTTCACSGDGRHYAISLLNEVYPGTPEGMWNLLFDSSFTKAFLTNEVMKGTDVQEDAWQTGTDGHRTKTTKYTKWLGLAIGPKTTKAILTDVCEHKDPWKYITTVTTTSTPDVPSGGSFTTKNRTCITWAGPNEVRVVVTGACEFTKSSWIKGQIEKGAAEGMNNHYRELNVQIRKHISQNPSQLAKTDVEAASPVPTMQRARKNKHAQEPNGSSEGTVVDQDTPITSPEKGTKQAHHHHHHALSSPQQPQPQPVSQFGSDAGILASLGKVFEIEQCDLTLLLMLAILGAVMIANIYIWFQISSVSTQMGIIQSEITSQRNNAYQQHHHQPPNRQLIRHSYPNQQQHESAFPDGASSGENDEYDLEMMEQEDAMWAWLTAREARLRQTRKAGVASWEKMRVQNKDKNTPSSASSSDSESLKEMERQLRKRIDDLQHQFEKLEAQAHHIEQETEAEDTVFSFEAFSSTPPPAEA